MDEDVGEAVKAAVHEALDERGYRRQEESEEGGRSVGSLFLLVGIGLAMAYVMRNRPESVESVARTASDRVRSGPDQADDWAEGTGHEASDRVESGGEQVAAGVERSTEDAADRFEDGGDAVGDAASDVGGDDVGGYEVPEDERSESGDDEP